MWCNLKLRVRIAAGHLRRAEIIFNKSSFMSPPFIPFCILQRRVFCWPDRDALSTKINAAQPPEGVYNVPGAVKISHLCYCMLTCNLMTLPALLFPKMTCLRQSPLLGFFCHHPRSAPSPLDHHMKRNYPSAPCQPFQRSSAQCSLTALHVKVTWVSPSMVSFRRC